jgi:hypothetical protein
MTFIKIFFYGTLHRSPTFNPLLEDHPLSFVRGCLFSIFVATLHSWRPFLYQGTYLKKEINKRKILGELYKENQSGLAKGSFDGKSHGKNRLRRKEGG